MKNLTSHAASRALVVAVLAVALAGCGTAKPKSETLKPVAKSDAPKPVVSASTGNKVDKTAKPPAPSKKPLEIMDSLARALNDPNFTEALKGHREEIVLWQEEVEAKKAPAPLILEPYADYITVASLEKALGKPDKKTVEKLPGFTRMTGVVTGNYYWYGNVGFGFLDGGNGIERIWVLDYVVK